MLGHQLQRARAHHRRSAAASAPPSAPTPGFDLVLVLDVLEHIADPADFIEHDLRPLTVAGHAGARSPSPPIPRLFGDHDRALGHHRRYTAERLLDEVAPWIDVVDHGPLFPSLVAPRAASVAVERAAAPGSASRQRHDGRRRRRTHGVGEWHHGPTHDARRCAACSPPTPRDATIRTARPPPHRTLALGVRDRRDDDRHRRSLLRRGGTLRRRRLHAARRARRHLIARRRRLDRRHAGDARLASPAGAWAATRRAVIRLDATAARRRRSAPACKRRRSPEAPRSSATSTPTSRHRSPSSSGCWR